MTTDPDQIRDEIERTRAELSYDVDALAYKASPKRMVRERTDRVQRAFRGARDKVMGAGDRASNAMSDTASSLRDKASDAPTMVKEKAEGNPIAAGLIVFGGAWLISSLLPRTRPEQEAVQEVKSTAQEKAGQLKDAATGAAQEVRDNMREPVQQAAQSVKSTASDAAQTVKEETKSAAHDVKGEAQQVRAQS